MAVRKRRASVLVNPVTLTVAVFFSHVITCGVSFSIGIYYITFLEIFGESNGMTSWIGSLNTGILCMAGPLTSLMIDRIGCRCTTVVGGLLSAVGLAAAAFSRTIYQLYLTLGVLTGVGYGLVFTSCIVSIATGVPEHRGVAFGITFSGVGVGSFCYPFLCTWLSHVYEWRGALLITSGLTLNVVVFGLFMTGLEKKSRHSGEAPFGVTSADDEMEISNDRDTCPMTHSVQSLCVLISSRMHEMSNMVASRRQCALFRSAMNIAPDEKSCRFYSLPQLHISQSRSPELPCRLHNGISQSKTSQLPYDLQKDANQSNASRLSRDHGDCALGNSVVIEDKLEKRNHAHCSDQLLACKLCGYWLLHFTTLFFFFSLSVALTHIFAYVRHQGMSENRATIIMSMNGAANVVGRIVLGALTQNRCMVPLLLCVACFLAAGVASMLMTVWITFPGFLTCVTAFGFFWGACGPVLTECVLDVVGPERFNFAYGFLMISMAIGTLLGAPTAGFVYDVSRRYTSSFYLGSSCMILSGLLLTPIMLLKTPARWRRTRCLDNNTQQGLT